VSNVFQIDFDDPKQYPLDSDLGGQNGWLSFGNGNAVVATNGISGSGNGVLLGADFSQPNVPEMFVWTPLNLAPPPHYGVRFTTTLHINDSTNRLFDVFSWQFFNHDTNVLFGIIFDNRTFGIEYVLDDRTVHQTGRAFQTGVAMELIIDMNFQHNVWQAQLDGAPLTPPVAISASGTNQITLNEIAAAWQANNPATPGDNHMIFDNYLVQLIELQLPPEIRDVPHSTNLLVGDELNLSVVAEGAGTLSHQWFKNGEPLVGQIGSNLVIPNVDLSHAGDYMVSVANVYGDVNSPPILVRVDLPVPPPPNDDFQRRS